MRLPGYSILKNLKLGVMFAVVISGAMITITTALYWLTYEKTKVALEENLFSQASSVLDFADVLLESRNEKFFSNESHEVPQIIQAEVFSKFTEISNGQIFFNQSSKEPMNPNNLAKKHEAQVIELFQKQNSLKEDKRYIVENGKEYLMVSRPMVAEQRCTMCHPTWTPGNVIAAEHVKVDTTRFYSDLQDNLYLLVGQWLLNLVLIIAIVLVLFKILISDRVNKLLQMMFRLENGSFILDEFLEGENLDKGASKNEIDRLFRHLAKVAQNLQPVIERVVKQSKDVAFRSSVAYINIDKNNHIINNQIASVTQANETIDNIMRLNGELTRSMQELQQTSKHSLEKVSQGQATVVENKDAAQSAGVAMEQTVEAIQSFENFSQEIEKTVEIITDIADETNLIALNAAIEAARAGVHGRSFAVVADKIRVLADVSLNNAEDIKTVVKSMKASIDSMVANANKTKEVILKLESSSDTLDKNFVDIDAAISQTTHSLAKFEKEFVSESKALEDINESLIEVTQKSHSVSSTSATLQKIMEDISNDSAELKLLSDGFEVVLENREAKRTVVTPPILGSISFDSGENFDEIYVFDKSKEGISFFAVNKNTNEKKKSMLGENATINLTKELHGIKSFRVKIVYCSMDKVKDTAFCGCQLI